MGIIRVFRKGVRFTFRARKRFLVFMLIFGIISTLVAFYIDSLDELRTDRFLEHNGVVVVQQSTSSVTYQEGIDLADAVADLEGDDGIEIQNYVIYNYAFITPGLMIWTFDHTKPWFSEFVKPSLVNDGDFPANENEAIVISGTSQVQPLGVNNVNLTSVISVGQELTFSDGVDSESFKVVGNFDGSNINVARDPGALWLFIDQSRFEDVLQLFGLGLVDGFTYSISFAVPGNVLQGGTHDKVKALNEGIQTNGYLQDAANYGLWQPTANLLPTDKAVDDRANLIAQLSFTVIGGIVMATMLAYLISRFRRREIAILKAMGYSNSSVRLSLLAEILTTSFMGFLVGITSAQVFILYLADFNFRSLLSLEALGVSFLINVVITLPGMLLASWRILRVSPGEAFRDR